MELTEYILTFFFDCPRHFIQLVILILVSFVTLRVSINKTNNNK